jgi:hypothetical protein
LECLVDVYGGEIRYTTTPHPGSALISSLSILQLCR